MGSQFEHYRGESQPRDRVARRLPFVREFFEGRTDIHSQALIWCTDRRACLLRIDPRKMKSPVAEDKTIQRGLELPEPWEQKP